jgi:hypothetical protein
MFSFRRLIFFPGYQYQFKLKFDFDEDHYRMSDIDTREPLFYHPLSEKYVVGTKLDPELADIQISFLRRFDRDITLYKTNQLPVPELTGLANNLLYRLASDVYEIIYHYAYDALSSRPYSYDVEVKVLNRISNLLR